MSARLRALMQWQFAFPLRGFGPTIIERTSRSLFQPGRFLIESPHTEMVIRLLPQWSTLEKEAPLPARRQKPQELQPAQNSGAIHRRRAGQGFHVSAPEDGRGPVTPEEGTL